MRRSDQLASIAALSVALGGCMVIYPDPELPDVVAEWFAEDCQPETPSVAVTLVGLDSTARAEVTVPCRDLTVTFADLAREQYRFEALLLDDTGEVFTRHVEDVDLRNGFDARLSVYFSGFFNFRAGWAFDMGATCESLGASAIAFELTGTDMTPAFELASPCVYSPYIGYVPDGTYTVRLRALSDATTVASSPESAEFVIEAPRLTDLGIITLSP